MSVKVDELEFLLNQLDVANEVKSKILDEVKALEEEKKSEREAGKSKAKNEFVVFVRGDEELQKVLQQAWIVQVPESSDNASLITRMQEAAGEHNASSKRKKSYITEWADFFEAVKRKFTKERNFHVKTKTPAQVIVLTKGEVGEIPVA